MSDKTRVLLVDDDQHILDAARRVLSTKVELVTALGGTAALEIMSKSEPFAVLISDQNMPELNGTAFLSRAAHVAPLTVRLMLTGNSDQKTAAAAVNTGRVYGFLTKPCPPEVMLSAIEEAALHHSRLKGERELLETTLAGSVKMLVGILAISHPKLFQRAMQVQKWARIAARELGWGKSWEMDMAALLWPIGEITLPAELLAKRDARAHLSAEETKLIDETPRAGRDLIVNIPRLKPIGETIYYCRRGFNGTGFPEDGPAGGAIPKMACLLRVLIDLSFAFEAEKNNLERAVARLYQDHRFYDPSILQVLPALKGSFSGGTATVQHITIQAQVAALKEGDIITADLKTADGRLILSAGNELTEPMIQKLRAINQLQKIPAPIKIMRAQATT